MTATLHDSSNIASVAVEWAISDHPVEYAPAVAAMEARAAAIAAGEARELVWLLEHPALYTAGTSARRADLLQPGRFPVHASGRGGQYTYHGPGQRIAYVMLDLNRRGRDVRAFVTALERWVIETLDCFNVTGETRPDRVGVWVRRPSKPPPVPGLAAEDKIAAIGIRLKRWVSLHGLSINLEPELDHFAGIVPCGIAGYGVTSLADLGLIVSRDELDMAMAGTFERRGAACRQKRQAKTPRGAACRQKRRAKTRTPGPDRRRGRAHHRPRCSCPTSHRNFSASDRELCRQLAQRRPEHRGLHSRDIRPRSKRSRCLRARTRRHRCRST
jgi:lipoyl(octanoyl) transferase